MTEEYGFVVLFAVSTVTSVLTLLYTIIFVQESRERSDYKITSSLEVTETSGPSECSWASLGVLLSSALRTLLKRRPHGGRTWILFLVVIFSICNMIELGDTSLWYMFFRLQYKMSDTLYSYLDTYFVVLWFFSQLLLIPFLSTRLDLARKSNSVFHKRN